MTEEAEVLDESALQRLVRIGGGKLASQMIDLFLEHGPERIGRAESGVAERDIRAVEHAAHSLKSSAGNLGASRLQAAAARAETAAEATPDDHAAIARLVQDLRTEYDAAESALRARRSELAE